MTDIQWYQFDKIYSLSEPLQTGFKNLKLKMNCQSYIIAKKGCWACKGILRSRDNKTRDSAKDYKATCWRLEYQHWQVRETLKLSEFCKISALTKMSFFWWRNLCMSGRHPFVGPPKVLVRKEPWMEMGVPPISQSHRNISGNKRVAKNYIFQSIQKLLLGIYSFWQGETSRKQSVE